MTEKDILIIGGGAAGFFTAINLAKQAPHLEIAILERGNTLLNKVKISGGGRCNVTHAEFLPQELIKNYPRGGKELRGPFHSFMTGDIISWFGERGVELKTEADGRMFPITDSSQTIIDCFMEQTRKLGIQILKKHAVREIVKKDEKWQISTSQGKFVTKKLMLATGSNPKIWNILEKLGHRIIPPVPSLFTFKIKDNRISDLPGIAKDVVVRVLDEKIQTTGPLLITHWGMSGPAILKLSAWGARELSTRNNFEIEVNWLPEFSAEGILECLKTRKQENPKQRVYKNNSFNMPKRLWQKLVLVSHISETEKWADLNKQQLQNLVRQLNSAIFQVNGKSTFKEEFVTAGGINLKEIDFKTFGSKIHENLYFAGEILNIDAITGGFNFQNAWTGGFIAAKAMAKSV